jgi:hypothetical protein
MLFSVGLAMLLNSKPLREPVLPSLTGNLTLRYFSQEMLYKLLGI